MTDTAARAASIIDNLRTPPVPAAEPPAAAAHVVRLSAVRRKPITWLWDRYIPAGKLTIIEGDPGDGKSTMTCDLAARVSAGRPMPDGSRADSGTVLFLTAEDGVEDTIAPRLEAARADVSHVMVLTEMREADERGAVTTRPVELPADLPFLARIIREEDVHMVVIDPLMAFLAGVDSHNDQSVRRALHPISKLAEDTGAAFVVVRHLNKASGGKAMYRGGGSIGIIGAARAGFLIAPDPDDEGGPRRLMAPVKMNIAVKPPTMVYRLVDAPEFGCARVEWDGTSDYRAEHLVAAETDDDRQEKKEATDFLREYLADGPRRSKEVEEEAREAWGIAVRTLKRARQKLGVRAEKIGREWWMALPAGAAEVGKGARGPLTETGTVAPLAPAGEGAIQALELPDAC
ncbi:AAA family ATPase [Streptomyces luteireticuli]|uniref:AAA family ATPase n=1 Tax=Streptomyces luteireticuli TaxID=173858 RepID=UPI003555C6A2